VCLARRTGASGRQFTFAADSTAVALLSVNCCHGSGPPEKRCESPVDSGSGGQSSVLARLGVSSLLLRLLASLLLHQAAALVLVGLLSSLVLAAVKAPLVLSALAELLVFALSALTELIHLGRAVPARRLLVPSVLTLLGALLAELATLAVLTLLALVVLTPLTLLAPPA